MIRFILFLSPLLFIIGISGTNEGDVRLIEGTYNSGILQIYHSGAWGGVCDNSFGYPDADVVCYQLGFFRSRFYSGGVYIQGDNFFWLSNLRCTGTEKAISICSRSSWGVHSCSYNEHVRVVCETDPCDYVSNGDCFIVSNTLFNWNDAEANCIAHGGHLATIKSSSENTNLRSLFSRSGYNMWIGLYYSGSGYVWVDKSTETYRASYYTHNTGTSYCVGTYYRYNYYWYTYSCRSLLRSVCRVPGANRLAACENCDLYLNGKCLFYVSARMSWNNAQIACKSFGGDLVSIHSYSDQQAIGQAFSEHTYFYNFYHYNSNLWIGYNDISNEGSWVWSDGTPSDYSFFGSTPYSSYDCAYMYYISAYNWYGTSCTSSFSFICSISDPTFNFQIAEETETYVALIWNAPSQTKAVDYYLLMLNDEIGNTTEIRIPGCASSYNLTHPDTDYDYTISIASCSAACCNDYKYVVTVKKSNEGLSECKIYDCDFGLNGDCFRYETLQLSWGVAEERCNDWGGHLASVRSYQEHLTIISNVPYNLSSSYVWIGLNDTRLEGNFVWIDGSPNNYSNWNGNSPNQNVLNDCVAIKFPTAFWKDLTCNATHYSLCRKLIPEKVNSVTIFSATQIGANYASLDWTSAVGQYVNNYILTVRILGRSNRDKIYLTSCTNSYNVSLSPLTTYSIALYTCGATCCDNTNAKIALTTLSEGSIPLLSAAPQNLTAIAISISSIKITWSAPCNKRVIGITHYLLSYRGLYADANVKRITFPNISLQDYTAEITGLQEYTAYYIQVVAVSSGGESLPASINYIRTLEAVNRIHSCDAPICDLSNNGVCFLYVTTLMSWMDAENNCIAWGGHLASITSAAENNKIGKITSSLYNTWIGLNDIASERDYVWVNGSTSPYRNWYDEAFFSYNDCVCMKTKSGSYKWDDLNCASKFAYICSQPLPVYVDAPVSLISTDIGSNHVTVSWESTSLLSLLHYILSVKAIGQNTVTTTLSSCVSSYTIQQLSEQSNYSISLYACSSTCCNNGGAVISASTSSKSTDSQKVVSKSPENLIASPMNGSAIMITWNAPCNDLIVNILNYRVMYAELEYDTSNRFITLQTTNNTNNTNHSAVVTGLKPYTAYYIQVIAVSSGGESLAASINYIKTLEAVPGVVQNISSVLISLSNAVISWLPPTLEHQNGVITRYNVVLMIGSNTVSTYIVSDQHIKLTSLIPATQYTIYVMAITNAGYGPETSYTFSSSNKVEYKSAPLNLIATTLSSDTIQVSWRPPLSDINVKPSYNLIYFKLSSDTTAPQIKYIPASDNNLTTMLTGLESYTAYSIKVVAFDSVGDCLASSIDYIRTLEAVPLGPPQQIALIYLTNNSAILRWSPPNTTLQNGLITHYKLMLNNTDLSVVVEQFSNIGPNNNVMMFSNLNQSTTYRVNIAAGNQVGEGPDRVYSFITKKANGASFLTTDKSANQSGIIGLVAVILIIVLITAIVLISIGIFLIYRKKLNRPTTQIHVRAEPLHLGTRSGERIYDSIPLVDDDDESDVLLNAACNINTDETMMEKSKNLGEPESIFKNIYSDPNNEKTEI